jgi:tetratricopeptide (TPR) repeat protein
MTFSMLRSLRHLPFFEALGALDTSSREWASTSAGLVTLRLFDLRRAEETGGSAIVAAEIGAVRDAIEAMPSEELARSILANVVDAAMEGPAASTERALPPLLAYGKALQLTARWLLAVDVFETLLEHPASGEQGDLALQAALKCAYCLRTANRFDEAESAYDRVRELAAAFDDRSAGFLSEIGRANVALQRGNFPKAEAMLDAVIASSSEAECAGAHARALHDRGAVAYRRGQREEALRFMHAALVGQVEPTQRDRLLGDIALVMGELGFVSETRDVHLLIEATAVEQDTRWLAKINLMELEAISGNEITFERHRRELAEAPLPPRLRALLLLDSAQGFRRFGRLDAARSALADAAEFADRHELNDLAFRAESALEQLDRERIRLVKSEPSPVVDNVLNTVRELREHALPT